MQKITECNSAEEEEEDKDIPSAQANTIVTPPAVPQGRPKQLTSNQLGADKVGPTIVGSAVLVDKLAGIELNLDGTPKGPYRHPNHATNKQNFQTSQNQQEQMARQIMIVEDLPEEAVRREGTRHRTHTPDVRRNILSVKPAKLNIAEFEGSDADSWIQNIEQYFSSARTPIEQRIEIVVSYLKGEAMQWWRGTSFLVHNMPWHRFYKHLTERFATTSICENVKAFHNLSQTGTVAQYITTFEQQMNLMRRDNPVVPDGYYMHSFISGLHPYIQSHLECFEPATIQKAMWFAGRIKKSIPPAPPPRTFIPFYKKQASLEPAKTFLPSSTPAATMIQQARKKGIKNLGFQDTNKSARFLKRHIYKLCKSKILSTLM